MSKKEVTGNDEEFLSGDLPGVSPPMPDISEEEQVASGGKTTLSDKVSLELQSDASAGTAELIRRSIPQLEQLAMQKKAISAQEKQILNKLKEHKVDTGPVKFVIKQRKVDLEYRNAYDLQVRMIRSALGESQLQLFDDNSVEEKEPGEEDFKTLPKKKGEKKSAGQATGNPAAKKAVESAAKKKPGNRTVKLEKRPGFH